MRTPVVLLLGVTVALALPSVVKDFTLFQLTMAMGYAIAVLGLNLLMGMSGQVSLGHSAFFAVGAYTTAGLVHLGCPWLATIPAAALLAGAAGLLFRIALVRLDGLDLALATFALGIATPQVLTSSLLSRWSGGAQGIALERPGAPAGIPLAADRWLYFLTLAVAAALMLGAWNVHHSRTGRALGAVRDHPTAASAMGIDPARCRCLAFGVSALYAGVGGSLSALAVGFVSPDSFTFALAVALFVGSVVGGVRSIAGALAGGGFILFVPNVAERISKGAAGVVYGLILLCVVSFAPGGVAGFASLVQARCGARAAERRHEEGSP